MISDTAIRPAAGMAALAIALGLATGAAAQTKWDMATPYADNEFQTRNDRQFAEDIKKATNGQLDITVHSAGSLIKNPEIKRAVQTGQVPLGEIFLSNLGPESPIYEVDAIPFLAPTYDEAWKLYEVAKPYTVALLAKQGLRLLYQVPWPSQAFFTKQPVTSLESLKGLKMRAYNAQTSRLSQLMMTVPVTVQAVEIPQAFSAGIIDTMFTSGTTAAGTRAWEYTKFMYDTGGWVPKNAVFVNERAFQRLPEATRTTILNAAQAAEERGWKQSKEANDHFPGVLAQNGIKIEPMTPKFRQELEAIGKTLTEEWLARAGEDGRKLIADYRAKLAAK